MDEIREQMDIANEISDAIAQPLGGEVYDDVCKETLKIFKILRSQFKNFKKLG